MNSQFSDTKGASIMGVQLMETLFLNALDIQAPHTLKRFLEVADFLGGFEDGLQVARTVVHRTAPKDRLDKIWEYVRLRKEMNALQGQIDSMEEGPDREEAQAQKGRLLSNIESYE